MAIRISQVGAAGLLKFPARLKGAGEPLRLLEQAPHSQFWDYDAIGSREQMFLIEKSCAISVAGRRPHHLAKADIIVSSWA